MGGGRMDSDDRSGAGVPTSAQIWNYWQGGSEHGFADREAGERWLLSFPGVTDLARSSRAFITRSVRFLAGEAGLDQVLDIGPGLPTANPTHELVERINPHARVGYVDIDQHVLQRYRALLGEQSRHVVLDADMCDPRSVLLRVAESLDLNRPVGLMLMGVLGHAGDEEQVLRVVHDLVGGLASGSYLAIHETVDTDPESVRAAEEYAATGAPPYLLRRPEVVADYFRGLNLVEPGLVPCHQWRPDGAEPAPEHASLCAVGRKP